MSLDLDPDSYLDKLRPKPVAIKSQQGIFDHVVRVMVKQRMPCVKINDIDGSVQLATFSFSGLTSPLLSFCSREDLRILQKVIGYDRLQLMDEQSILLPLSTSEHSFGRQKYNVLSETEKEDGVKLTVFLQGRGFDHAGMMLLCALEEAHTAWFDELRFEDFKSQTSYGNDTKSMHALYKQMDKICYLKDLERAVLDFSKP